MAGDSLCCNRSTTYIYICMHIYIYIYYTESPQMAGDSLCCNRSTSRASARMQLDAASGRVWGNAGIRPHTLVA